MSGERGMTLDDKLAFIEGFKPRLDAYKKATGKSQKEIAYKAEVHPRQISGLKDANSGNWPGYSDLRKICKTIGTGVDQCVNEGYAKINGEPPPDTNPPPALQLYYQNTIDTIVADLCLLADRAPAKLDLVSQVVKGLLPSRYPEDPPEQWTGEERRIGVDRRRARGG